MPQNLSSKELLSNEMLLVTEYLSEIKIEMEIMKKKALQKGDEDALKHLATMNNALACIMDARTEFADRFTRFLN